jgi:radical SAM protein with 4Fe4S-binding SPASM domain
MRENIEEADQLRALAEEIGVSSFRGAYMVIHRRDGSAGVADMRATPEQLRAVAQRGYERHGEKGIPPEPEPLTEEQKQETSPCGAGQSSCRIDSYGNVYPCAAIDTGLGNLREEKFAAIWSGSELLKQIRAIRIADLPECRSCHLFMRCSRCAGLAKMETGSLLAASRQACVVAHAFEDFFQEKRCELQ